MHIRKGEKKIRDLIQSGTRCQTSDQGYGARIGGGETLTRVIGEELTLAKCR